MPSSDLMQPTGPDSITVVPMRLMPETAARLGAGGIISVLNAHLMPETPPGFEHGRHLRLAMSDATAKDVAAMEAMAQQISRLVEFAKAWDRKQPLVVHCFSGLNRSPAAAFITLCALNPGTPEPLIAALLRQACDTAAPHRQMVAIADHLLARDGHMIDAIDAIGPGAPSAEARPFTLAATITSGSYQSAASGTAAAPVASGG